MPLHIYAPLWEMPAHDYPTIEWQKISQEQAIFSLCGLELDTKQEYPVAALRYHFDVGSVENQVYCCADPIYLHADRQALRLFDPPQLGLSQAEADAVMASLNATYADEGWQFSAPTPDHWYLQLAEKPQLKTYSLSESKGYDITQFIPQGMDSKTWHLYMNEIQMLLHQHPVNEARQAAGKLPISSVWFWGMGQLPQLPTPRWTQVYHRDSFSGGLAKLQQIPTQTFNQVADLLDKPLSDNILCVDLGFQTLQKTQTLFSALAKVSDEVFIYTQNQRLHLRLPQRGLFTRLHAWWSS